jgi:hypothetical protein
MLDLLGKGMLRLICGILFLLWLALVLLGKGGFAHLILLVAIGIAFVEVMTVYRTKLSV